MKSEEYDMYLTIMKEAFPYAKIVIECLPEMFKARIDAAKAETPLSENVEFIYNLTGNNYLKMSFSRQDMELFDVQSMAENILRMLKTQKKIVDDPKQKDYRDGILLNHILHVESKEMRTYTSLLAVECGKSLNVKRAVCVLKCMEEWRITEKAVEIINVMRSMKEYSSQDIMGVFGEKQIVICKEVIQKDVPLKIQFQDWLEKILYHLEQKFGVKYRIGVGMTAEKLDEYARNLQIVMQVMDYQDEDEPVKYVSDSLIECIVTNHDARILDHFLEDGIQVLKRNPELFQVAESLIKNNMNQIETANKLYLHRNTVALYLKKLKQLLCIDPVRRDEDKFYLMLLCGYYRLKNRNM